MPEAEVKKWTVAILGGTGALGSGLALRLAGAGHGIVLGSRDPVRAAERAADLVRETGGSVEGASYSDAAKLADLAILTVPFAGRDAILENVKTALAGKILIDATVPLVPPKVSRVQLPVEGSAAVIAQQLLGPEVTVVSAFQNVGAHHLGDGAGEIDCDVLVAGDDPAARQIVVDLAADCGLRGWHAGPLANAAAAEALTSVLIFMNRHYKSDRAGIRITGTSPASERAAHSEQPAVTA